MKRARSLSPLGLSMTPAKDSSVFILDSTSSTTNGGFISILDPLSRRSLLGAHEAFCRSEKEHEIARKQRQQPFENQFWFQKGQPISFDQLFAEEQQQEEFSNNSSTSHEEHSSSSVVNDDSSVCILLDCDYILSDGYSPSGSFSIVSYNDDTIQQHENDTLRKRKSSSKKNQQRPLFFQTACTNTKLDEPWILRTSIYDKFIGCFQAFYNRHDTVALVEQLFQPCCVPDMKRELRIWAHHSTQKGLEPIQYHSDCDVDIGTPMADVFRLVAIRRVCGSQNIFSGYNHMFEKLPDCVMLFHSHCSTVTHIGDSGRVVVVSPYTYYFSVLVPDTNLNYTEDEVKSESQAPRSPSRQRRIKVAETECRVWYVTRYNRHGLVESDCFHIIITACSDPSVSTNDIVQYIGLEGLSINDPYEWR